jgi:hypothetical protein
LLDLELDLRALVQASVTFSTDGTVVDEDVGTVLTGDESVTLEVVEPFDLSLRHDRNLLVG